MSTVELAIEGAFHPRKEARGRPAAPRSRQTLYGRSSASVKGGQRLLGVPQVGHDIPLLLGIANFAGAQRRFVDVRGGDMTRAEKHSYARATFTAVIGKCFRFASRHALHLAEGGDVLTTAASRKFTSLYVAKMKVCHFNGIQKRHEKCICH